MATISIHGTNEVRLVLSEKLKAEFQQVGNAIIVRLDVLEEEKEFSEREVDGNISNVTESLNKGEGNQEETFAEETVKNSNCNQEPLPEVKIEDDGKSDDAEVENVSEQTVATEDHIQEEIGSDDTSVKLCNSRIFTKDQIHDFEEAWLCDSLSNKDIAELFNCTPCTVYRMARKLNLPSRRGISKEKAQKICEAYKTGASFEKIMMDYNVSYASIKKILTENEIPIREKALRTDKIRIGEMEAIDKMHFQNPKMPVSAIAQELGLNTCQVRHYFKKMRYRVES